MAKMGGSNSELTSSDGCDEVLYNHIKTSSSSGNDDLNVTPTKNKCVTPTRKTEREQVRPEIARSTSKMLKHVTPSSDLTDSTLVVTQLKNRTVKHVTPPTMTEHSSRCSNSAQGEKCV